MCRNLSLSLRNKEVREPNKTEVTIKFTLGDIKDHFQKSLNQVISQYDVKNPPTNIDICKTIWRSQVVLAEGLLDFFIHEMSKFCLLKMFTGEWEKSKKYFGLMVPMSKFEEAIYVINSNDWFLGFINERFCRDVFLSYESMKDQLNLIGIDYSATMNRAFKKDGITDPVKYGGNIIRKLFQRRNEITHPNDRSHTTAEQQDIDKEFVDKYISDIETIVNAIYYIASNKDEHNVDGMKKESE